MNVSRADAQDTTAVPRIFACPRHRQLRKQQRAAGGPAHRVVHQSHEAQIHYRAGADPSHRHRHAPSALAVQAGLRAAGAPHYLQRWQGCAGQTPLLRLAGEPLEGRPHLGEILRLPAQVHRQTQRVTVGHRHPVGLGGNGDLGRLDGGAPFVFNQFKLSELWPLLEAEQEDNVDLNHVVVFVDREAQALRRNELGADAIVGVDLDYEHLGGENRSMLMVSASGTSNSTNARYGTISGMFEARM